MKDMDDSINPNKALIMHLKYFLRLMLICGISAVLSIAMSNMGINKENTLMVFLVGVLTVASVTRGYFYGAVASVLSVMLFNYFFTEPLHTLLINKAEDLMLLLFFLIASLITSSMTSKFQYQATIAKRNEKTARLLYEITKGFLNVTGTDNIVYKGIKYIHDNLGYECRVKLDYSDNIYCNSDFPVNEEHEKPVSYTIPIKGASNQIGTIEIIDLKLPITSKNDMMIKTIVYQIAIVLDREFIYNEREKIET